MVDEDKSRLEEEEEEEDCLEGGRKGKRKMNEISLSLPCLDPRPLCLGKAASCRHTCTCTHMYVLGPLYLYVHVQCTGIYTMY